MAQKFDFDSANTYLVQLKGFMGKDDFSLDSTSISTSKNMLKKFFDLLKNSEKGKIVQLIKYNLKLSYYDGIYTELCQKLERFSLNACTTDLKKTNNYISIYRFMNDLINTIKRYVDNKKAKNTLRKNLLNELINDVLKKIKKSQIESIQEMAQIIKNKFIEYMHSKELLDAVEHKLIKITEFYSDPFNYNKVDIGKKGKKLDELIKQSQQINFKEIDNLYVEAKKLNDSRVAIEKFVKAENIKNIDFADIKKVGGINIDKLYGSNVESEKKLKNVIDRCKELREFAEKTTLLLYEQNADSKESLKKEVMAMISKVCCSGSKIANNKEKLISMIDSDSGSEESINLESDKKDGFLEASEILKKLELAVVDSKCYLIVPSRLSALKNFFEALRKKNTKAPKSSYESVYSEAIKAIGSYASLKSEHARINDKMIEGIYYECKLCDELISIIEKYTGNKKAKNKKRKDLLNSLANNLLTRVKLEQMGILKKCIQKCEKMYKKFEKLKAREQQILNQKLALARQFTRKNVLSGNASIDKSINGLQPIYSDLETLYDSMLKFQEHFNIIKAIKVNKPQNIELSSAILNLSTETIMKDIEGVRSNFEKVKMAKEDIEKYKSIVKQLKGAKNTYSNQVFNKKKKELEKEIGSLNDDSIKQIFLNILKQL